MGVGLGPSHQGAPVYSMGAVGGAWPSVVARHSRAADVRGSAIAVGGRGGMHRGSVIEAGGGVEPVTCELVLGRRGAPCSTAAGGG